MHHAVLEEDNIGVVGAEGQLSAGDVQQLGVDSGVQNQSGVAGVGGQELGNAVVLNSELSNIHGGNVEVLVDHSHGQETPDTAGSSRLSIQSHQVDGADLAVEGIQPSEVIAVALGVGVGTGHAVQVVDVVVDEAVAVLALDQSGDLEDLGGDVLRNGGVHDLLDSGLGDPGLVEVVVALVVADQGSIVQLVAAVVAVLGSVSALGLQDPVGLVSQNSDLVADSHAAGNIAVVNIDGAGAVNQDNTAGNHAVSEGDASNNAGHLDLGALGSLTGLGNGHLGVVGLVELFFHMDVVDQTSVLNLDGALVVADDAVQQDLVALEGLLGHLAVLQSAINAVGAVNIDGTGLVGQGHFTVQNVLHLSDSADEVVTVGGSLAVSQVHSQSLSNGDGLVLSPRICGFRRISRLGRIAGNSGGSGGGVLRCAGSEQTDYHAQNQQKQDNLLHI